MGKQIDSVALFRSVLSEDDRRKAFEACRASTATCNRVIAELLAPVMYKVDEFTGQQNDVNYIAYLFEHTFNSVGEF